MLACSKIEHGDRGVSVNEALGLEAVLAEQVRLRRSAQGLTAEQLATRIGKMGGRLSRQAISKIEHSDRSVSIEELVLLGRALRVPPILLLFPFDQVELVKLPANVEAAAWDAASWFTGRAPFPHDQDRDATGQVIAETGDAEDLEAFEQGAVPVDLWSEHERLLTRWRIKVHTGDVKRRGAEKARTDDERSARLRNAEQADREAQSIVGALWDVRRRMRQHGIRTPELPELLRDVADRDPLAVAVERHYEKGGSE